MATPKTKKTTVQTASAKKATAKKRTQKSIARPKETNLQEVYLDFLRNVELESILLEKSLVEGNTFFKPTKGLISIKKNPKVTIGDGKSGFTIRDNLRLEIEIEGQEKPVVKMNITFSLRYKCKTPCEKHLVDIFVRKNLDIHSWPYFREYIQSTISRMGLPPLVLPTRL